MSEVEDGTSERPYIDKFISIRVTNTNQGRKHFLPSIEKGRKCKYLNKAEVSI
ncbi:hypothetical protein D921_02237 [Enterococcus faecalis F01966]|nr:hypothetical protein D921_02237 [Enterococcus faecalis F01966]EPI31451.1 hypothetical protein D350_01144 [Enterococcus faecalis VC1B-1]